MGDSPPARRLPAELTTRIFSYLQADKPSLATCSLVSLAWAPVAQRCLFRVLKVYPASARNEDVFLQFLEGHPELCQHVKLLTIARSPFAAVNLTPTVFISKIASILRLLPTLRSFTLVELELLPSYPPLPLGPLNPVLKALHSLELSSVGLEGPIEHRSTIVLEFLQLFSSISELVVSDFRLDHKWEEFGVLNDVPPLEMPPAFQVRSLSIPAYSGSTIPILEMIKRTSRRSLCKLDTFYPPPIELSPLQNLINETSPQLSELSLDMDNDDLDDDEFDSFESLSLSNCTALQALKFSLPTDFAWSWGPSPAACFDAMIDIIHSLPSTTGVTRLHLKFSYASPSGEKVVWALESLDWARLERLALSRLQVLEELKVTFDRGSGSAPAAWRELIREKFGHWSNVKVLRFDDGL